MQKFEVVTGLPGGVIARQDPPPVEHRGGGGQRASNWRLISDQLRAEPGQWFLVAIGPHALSQRPKIVNAVSRNWQPLGSFDSCTRQIDGEVHLFVKYVGRPGDDT